MKNYILPGYNVGRIKSGFEGIILSKDTVLLN